MGWKSERDDKCESREDLFSRRQLRAVTLESRVLFVSERERERKELNTFFDPHSCFYVAFDFVRLVWLDSRKRGARAECRLCTL